MWVYCPYPTTHPVHLCVPLLQAYTIKGPPNQRTVQDKASYLCQVIPFVLQELIHSLRRKVRCGKDRDQCLQGPAQSEMARVEWVPKGRVSCICPSPSGLRGWLLARIFLGASTPNHPSLALCPHRLGSPHPPLTLNNDFLHCHGLGL